MFACGQGQLGRGDVDSGSLVVAQVAVAISRCDIDELSSQADGGSGTLLLEVVAAHDLVFLRLQGSNLTVGLGQAGDGLDIVADCVEEDGRQLGNLVVQLLDIKHVTADVFVGGAQVVH